MALTHGQLYSLIYDTDDIRVEAPEAEVPRGQVHLAARRIIAGIDRQRLNSPLIVRFGSNDVSYAELENFSLALDTADVSVSTLILHHKVHEPHVTAFIREHLKPGMHFIDIGANVGYFVQLAAQLVTPAGKVTAIEPNSENARLILLSMEKNQNTNVTLLPVALSNRMGNAFFSSHVGSNGGLLPNNTSVLLSAGCIVVPTFRLDQLIADKVDLIKIDVEGAEGLAIDGAWNIIERDRPIVVSEFASEMLRRVSGIQPADYIRRFTSAGYKAYRIDKENVTPHGVEITDLDQFMEQYGFFGNLEDIAFIPQ